MKGFFKGLRSMFDTDDDKEPEIQIGNPTDVKHVAHIGCDGPSTPAPSWMNEFQNGSQSGDTKDSGAATASSSRAKTKQSKRQTKSSKTKNSILGSEEQSGKKTRKKKDGTRSSKTKNKDSSDAGCSDGVCKKPLD